MFFQKERTQGNSWNPRNKFRLLRYISYPIFIILILYKLTLLDKILHIPYIEISLMDYVIAIGSVMIVSFWTFWLPRRSYLVSLILLNLLLTAIIYSDLVYYRYFEDFITIPVCK